MFFSRTKTNSLQLKVHSEFMSSNSNHGTAIPGAGGSHLRNVSDPRELCSHSASHES